MAIKITSQLFVFIKSTKLCIFYPFIVTCSVVERPRNKIVLLLFIYYSSYKRAFPHQPYFFPPLLKLIVMLQKPDTLYQ